MAPEPASTKSWQTSRALPVSYTGVTWKQQAVLGLRVCKQVIVQSLLSQQASNSSVPDNSI
jgi:hypothetical protein